MTMTNMNFLNKLESKNRKISEAVPIRHLDLNINFPIFKTNLNTQIDNGKIKELILDYKEKHPKNYTTNVAAWRSSWYTHKITTAFNPLIEIFESTTNALANNIFKSKLKVINFWTLIYSNSEYTRWHNHGYDAISLVYYVDVDANSAPLEFYNDVENLTFQPKSGDVLIFNGLALHKVPKIKVPSPRIVIASNLMYTK